MSVLLTTFAYVLQKSSQGEQSQRIKFFTKEQGVVHASFKGARQPKKQALLEFFTPLCVYFSLRRDWHYVQEVEILAPSPRFDRMQLWSAYYLNELLAIAMRPNDAHEQLFDAYTWTLSALTTAAKRNEIEVILRQFEQVFLTACGCGFFFPDEIVLDAYYCFQAEAGFLLSETGYAGKILLAWQQARWEEEGVLIVAKAVMREAVQHAVLGKSLRVREMMKGL